MSADQSELSRARRAAHHVDHHPVQRLDAVERAGIERLFGNPWRVLEHAAEQLDEALALQALQLTGGDAGRRHHIFLIGSEQRIASMDRARA